MARKTLDSKTTSNDESISARIGKDGRTQTGESTTEELGGTVTTETTTKGGKSAKFANIGATIQFKIKVHGRFPTGAPGAC